MVLNQGQYCPPRDVWYCLATFWLHHWEAGAAGIWQVEVRDGLHAQDSLRNKEPWSTVCVHTGVEKTGKECTKILLVIISNLELFFFIFFNESMN